MPKQKTAPVQASPEPAARSPRTSAEWTAALADLRAAVEAKAAHVSRLDAERKGLALDASLGNAKAKRRLSEIAADTVAFQAEARDLGSAIQAAEQRLREAQAVEAEERERVRRADVERIAAERRAAAEKADRAMAELAGALAEMDAATNRLASLGARTPHLPARRLWAAGAARHHGLDRFLPVGPAAGLRTTTRPLVDQHDALVGAARLGVGAPAATEEAIRRHEQTAHALDNGGDLTTSARRVPAPKDGGLAARAVGVVMAPSSRGEPDIRDADRQLSAARPTGRNATGPKVSDGRMQRLDGGPEWFEEATLREPIPDPRRIPAAARR